MAQPAGHLLHGERRCLEQLDLRTGLSLGLVEIESGRRGYVAPPLVFYIAPPHSSSSQVIAVDIPIYRIPYPIVLFGIIEANPVENLILREEDMIDA